MMGTGGGPALPETPEYVRTVLAIVPKEGMVGCAGVERLVNYPITH